MSLPYQYDYNTWYFADANKVHCKCDIYCMSVSERDPSSRVLHQVFFIRDVSQPLRGRILWIFTSSFSNMYITYKSACETICLFLLSLTFVYLYLHDVHRIFPAFSSVPQCRERGGRKTFLSRRPLLKNWQRTRSLFFSKGHLAFIRNQKGVRITEGNESKYKQRYTKQKPSGKSKQKQKKSVDWNMSRRCNASGLRGTWMLNGPTVPLQIWDDSLYCLSNANRLRTYSQTSRQDPRRQTGKAPFSELKVVFKKKKPKIPKTQTIFTKRWRKVHILLMNKVWSQSTVQCLSASEDMVTTIKDKSI